MAGVEYEIKEFVRDGSSTFGEWFEGLGQAAARKITTAVYRLQFGNFSQVKPLGGGVYEYKIDYGPGYRIYFGRDLENLIILLSGGTKKRQGKDIEEAKALWLEYKARKKAGR